ncbi:FUSC family protein [Bordetella petrii]
MLLGIGLSNINLQAVYTPLDFGTFLDASSSTLIGIYTGSLCIHIVRKMGASHTADRLRRQERRDIAVLTQQANPRALEGYGNRSLDRISSITSRHPAHNDQSTNLLSWLRAGIAIGTIRQTCASLTDELREASESLLTEARLELMDRGSHTLLNRIDDALTATCKAGSRAPDALVRGLVGLRLALFEKSPPWRYAE